MATILREFSCNWCQQFFYVCQCCYRGQLYCCDGCRDAARRKSRRKSQHLYRTSDNGRKMNRQGANRRRINKENEIIAKNVADHTSTPIPSLVIVPPVRPEIPYCHKCGQVGLIVDEFPPRGYGNKRYQQFSAPDLTAW